MERYTRVSSVHLNRQQVLWFQLELQHNFQIGRFALRGMRPIGRSGSIDWWLLDCNHLIHKLQESHISPQRISGWRNRMPIGRSGNTAACWQDCMYWHCKLMVLHKGRHRKQIRMSMLSIGHLRSIRFYLKGCRKVSCILLQAASCIFRRHISDLSCKKPTGH